MLKLIAAVVCTLGLAWQAGADEPSITIVGTGTVTEIPDLAVVTVSVETEAETAHDAQAENTSAAAQTILALRQSGVSAGDIRTQSFSVSPVYSDRRSSGDYTTSIRGYLVVNRIEATVRDISALGTVLDLVVEKGANRVDSLRFGVADRQTLMDEARRRAVADAVRRAELMAQATGVILGPIQTISEGTRHGGGPVHMAEARAATTIAPGSLDVSASVTITWSIFTQ